MAAPPVSFNESYVGLRRDIIEQFEQHVYAGRPLRVLDVGCSTGVNGTYLLDADRADTVVGIEYDPEMAGVAKQNYAEVLVGDLEAMDFSQLDQYAPFDCMIFGDVLEHLRSANNTLDSLLPYLRPGGKVIISVPNMQHINAVWQLAVKGYWPMNDRGIFDRTHLRIFTRKNLLELVRETGLEDARLHRNFRYGDAKTSRFPFFGVALIRLLPDYYTYQYLVTASKPT